jgi:hypothetical protein
MPVAVGRRTPASMRRGSACTRPDGLHTRCRAPHRRLLPHARSLTAPAPVPARAQLARREVYAALAYEAVRYAVEQTLAPPSASRPALPRRQRGPGGFPCRFLRTPPSASMNTLRAAGARGGPSPAHCSPEAPRDVGGPHTRCRAPHPRLSLYARSPTTLAPAPACARLAPTCGRLHAHGRGLNVTVALDSTSHLRPIDGTHALTRCAPASLSTGRDTALASRRTRARPRHPRLRPLALDSPDVGFAPALDVSRIRGASHALDGAGTPASTAPNRRRPCPHPIAM